MRTSPAHCICWCDARVAADGRGRDSQNVFPLTRIYLAGGDEATDWIAEDEGFARSVSSPCSMQRATGIVNAAL